MFSQDQSLNAPFHAFLDKLLQANLTYLVKQGKLRETLAAVINCYTQARDKHASKKAQIVECVICTTKGKTMAETNCRHTFCYQCITDWHKSNIKCPSCRENVNWLLIRCAKKSQIKRKREEWIKAGGCDWLQVMQKLDPIKRQRERSRSEDSESQEQSLDSFIASSNSSQSSSSSFSSDQSQSQSQPPEQHKVCTYCLSRERKGLLVNCESCGRKQLHIRCQRKDQLSETRLCKDCMRVFKSALG